MDTHGQTTDAWARQLSEHATDRKLYGPPSKFSCLRNRSKPLPHTWKAFKVWNIITLRWHVLMLVDSHLNPLLAWIRAMELYSQGHKARFAWIAKAGCIATLFCSIQIIETKAMMHEGLPVVKNEMEAITLPFFSEPIWFYVAQEISSNSLRTKRTVSREIKG